MKKHQLRLIAIIAVFLGCIAGLVTSFFVSGEAVAKVQSALIGMLTLLVPAVLDALAVERRRIDPMKKTVEDDVIPDLVERAWQASTNPPPPAGAQ